MKVNDILNWAHHIVTACLFALATSQGFGQAAAAPAVPSTLPTKPQQTATALTSPQPPASVPVNRMIILLDPAHGGVDSGSRISDSTAEKDVTLAFAFRLRSLLSARGFTVIMTREADTPPEPDPTSTALTLDSRAGIANHARAAACLLLHATGSGTGVHLYHSELDATAGVPSVEPWLTAQAAWIPQSHDLEKQIAAALTHAGIALVTNRASVRPLDSLSCPAMVVELSPQGDDPDSINDVDYQQRVAQAIAGALVFWPTRVQPPLRLSTTAAPNNQTDPETQP
jgi:N-acetylmuramoyl-L-alanine amidase